MKVGLGTDIAGGYSTSIMEAMRQAVVVSRMREGGRVVSAQSEDKDGVQDTQGLSINWKEALYLATRGGLIALDVPRSTGKFEIGAAFDVQCGELKLKVIGGLILNLG